MQVRGRIRAGTGRSEGTRSASGPEPATARARQLALRRFSAWLLEQGESEADHSGSGLRAPKLDTKVVEPLTPEQIRALVVACAGRDRGRLAAGPAVGQGDRPTTAPGSGGAPDQVRRLHRAVAEAPASHSLWAVTSASARLFRSATSRMPSGSASRSNRAGNPRRAGSVAAAPSGVRAIVRQRRSRDQRAFHTGAVDGHGVSGRSGHRSSGVVGTRHRDGAASSPRTGAQDAPVLTPAADGLPRPEPLAAALAGSAALHLARPGSVGSCSTSRPRKRRGGRPAPEEMRQVRRPPRGAH
jgi:hypothetical protein